MTKYRALLSSLILASSAALPLSALADDKAELEALKARVKKLEELLEKQNTVIEQGRLSSEERDKTLAKEIHLGKSSTPSQTPLELKSQHGLSPGASEVYSLKQGVSVGGYAEGLFTNYLADGQNKNSEADFYRLVTYLGYKFSDKIVFNSELEFEHATNDGIGGQTGDSGGEFAVEFATLDFLHDPAFNSRAGLVLIPLGFVNEIHEPPFFYGVKRPDVERYIIPSTWREMGFGVFGEIEAGGKLEYKSYLVNGLRASRFSEQGIRDGRQSGNKAQFEDIAWTGRLDFSPERIPGLLVGGAMFMGNSGQNEEFSGERPDVFTLIGETHAQYKASQLELRALAVWGNIDDADLLSAQSGTTIPEEIQGWYLEAAYDILPHFVGDSSQSLAPFIRYESYNTQSDVPSAYQPNLSLDKRLFTLGLNYKPHRQVVLKLDYRNYEVEGPKPTADELNLGLGVVF